ncbi:MAG: hypothetical protein EA417_01435 [Gammaproteobacteria bacterium]|nr:MAG: hypothetical protein EA417_01435 [Gammaproteobacteria bacterium]
MNALWLAPLILVGLALLWAAVQRAWLVCMDQPASADALARSGPCGCDCAPGSCPSSEISPAGQRLRHK